MTGELPSLPKQIALALDATPESIKVLDIVAEIASVLEAQLDAVFIEDQALLSLSEFPFSEEISLYSPLQPLQKTRLEQEYRALSKQLQKALEQSAVRWKLHWQFRTIRANLNQALEQISHEIELVTLMTTCRGLQRSYQFEHEGTTIMKWLPHSCIFLPRHITPGNEIMVLIESKESRPPLMALALRFANLRGKSIVVLDSTDEESSISREKLYEQSSLGEKVDTLTWIPITSIEPEKLLRLLEQRRIHLLLTAKSTATISTQFKIEMAEKLKAPLYLLG